MDSILAQSLNYTGEMSNDTATSNQEEKLNFSLFYMRYHVIFLVANKPGLLCSLSGPADDPRTAFWLL